MVSFHLGTTPYSYITGQSESLGEAWRISMMRSMFDSGFFSLLIFIINYWFNKNKQTKIFFLILSFYFLIFSGIRSMLIIFLMFVLFDFLLKKIELKDRVFYRLYNWVFFGGFILFMFSSSLLIDIAQKIDRPFFNQIILKQENAEISQEDLNKTIYRTWIWEQHYQIFMRNPLIGVGTFDFSKEATECNMPGESTGSESPLTGFFARVGICTIFLILFFRKLWIKGLILNEKYKYFLPLLILVSMMSYGSYFNPYNFFFLILFASYNGICTEGIGLKNNVLTIQKTKE
jgi:hypothetical protein